jgi:hypothetical protein
MYRCSECGHIFEEGEFKSWIEPHGEEMQGCPICLSVFEEVKPCKMCGSYNHNAESDVCDKCKKGVEKRFADFVEQNFTAEERKLLNDLYDGKDI